MSRLIQRGAFVLLFLLGIANFACAAEKGLAINRGMGLNYEAVRVRIAIAKQIEVMNSLRDALQFCESYFPIQTRAEIQENVGMDAWSVYKRMFDMETSGEVFAWYLEFLSENEHTREILQRTFVRVEDTRPDEPVFRLGESEFTVRLFWLYAASDGVQIAAQEDMSDEIANQIWETGGVRYIFELRFPLSETLRKSPFWEKGAAHGLLKSFPSATIQEDPFELRYMVFPNGSSIPAIISRTLETRGIAPGPDR